MELKNARIIITGGTSGLGKAMAILLLEKGAKVIITGRDEAKLNSNEQDVKATYQFTIKELGGLDVLINNAGIGTARKPIDELDINEMRRIYDVNVFGAAMMAKEAALIFKKQKSGNIVNIASTAALNGYEGGTIYSSSKFALRGLSFNWQADLRKLNVRVMNINPSYVTTAFNQADRKERAEEENKLRPNEIALATVSALEMDSRGYIPELTVHATNPF